MENTKLEEPDEAFSKYSKWVSSFLPLTLEKPAESWEDECFR